MSGLLTTIHHQGQLIVAMTKLQLGLTLAFRAETLMWGLFDVIPFFALFFVLQSIYADTAGINGATLASTLQFYLVVVMVQALTGTHFEEWLGEQVRNGKIDLMLVKPLSPNFLYGYTGVVRKYVSTIIKLPLLMGLGVFVWRQFGVPFPLPSPEQAISLVMIILFGLFVQVMWSLTLAWFAFWFENGASLVHFKWMILALFSGSMFPPQLAPAQLNHIIAALPFKYFGVVPTELWMGNYALTAGDWVNMGVCAVVSLALLTFTWKVGNRHYASAGG